ncbi:MAG: alpha/beta fold hydrolase [Muribaculaceae bacterium]|nr:alpha/beta fold hydrolase [Muribaculaceae bacterium]
MKYLTLALALTLTACAASALDSEVRVCNTGAGISLGGTLSVPEGTPKAVLVLASGSGRQNRDEEIAGHRPFRTIADSLTLHGYAVLRLDDRGIGASGGDFAAATNSDFVSDISAALTFVDSLYTDIPAGVLGHSEGGTTAIRVAVADPRCRFIVTLAAPAWPGDSVIMSQGRAMAVAMTGTWENEALQRGLLDIAKGPLSAIQAQMAIYGRLAEAAGNDATALPQVRSQLNAAAASITSPWYREMLRYDPSADIAAVGVPWLALNGERDMQVLPANLRAISEINGKANTMLLPGHNHLFQKCTTGMPDEYARLTEDISEETLAAIAAWLDNNIHR